MKSDHDIIVESMAARIRELEGELAAAANISHENSEKAYDLNNGIKIALSDFIVESTGDNTTLLDFDQYIDRHINRLSIFQPDLLDAYLWVFEGLINDDKLKANKHTGLSQADVERIKANAREYRSQLRHWDKTGEEPVKK